MPRLRTASPPTRSRTRLYNAFGPAQVSTIYTASDQFWVLMQVDPNRQGDTSVLSSIYITPTQPAKSSTATATSSPQLVPLSAVTRTGNSVGPATINHLGQVPAVTVSFNLAPGMSLSDAVGRRRQGGRGSAHAGHDHHLVPGHRAIVPGFGGRHGHPADARDLRDLPRARHPLRELHPSADDSLRPADRGVRRAADADGVRQGSRSLRRGRPDHADRHRQEERDHDDRLRAGEAARGRGRRRMRSSTPA